MNYQYLIFVLAVLFIGCSPEEKIRTYQVTAVQEPIDSKSKQEVLPKSEKSGENKSRTLGLIIPLSDRYSRFVKFSGNHDAISKYESDFIKLIESITDIGTEESLPKFMLPEGWVENPPRQFVAKSFRPAKDPNAPEITLSMPIGGSLLDNVNRWRKEVGADEITIDALSNTVREYDVTGKKIILVDVSGAAKPGKGMRRGPFMGGQ